MIRKTWFEVVMGVVILCATLCAILCSPETCTDEDLKTTAQFNILFLTLFIVEALIKLFALGVWETRHGYFSNP